MHITDEQIDAMSISERRELIDRLKRDDAPAALPPETLKVVRRVRLGLMTAGSALMIPWTIYLALTLPPTYSAQNWAHTWVGFDVLLLVSMALTAWLGWRRRQLALLTSFATGVLLICDAWFDVMTATETDTWESLASAFLAELPLAGVLILGSLRILRFQAERAWLVKDGQRLWTVPLTAPVENNSRPEVL